MKQMLFVPVSVAVSQQVIGEQVWFLSPKHIDTEF